MKNLIFLPIGLAMAFVLLASLTHGVVHAWALLFALLIKGGWWTAGYVVILALAIYGEEGGR